MDTSKRINKIILAQPLIGKRKPRIYETPRVILRKAETIKIKKLVTESILINLVPKSRIASRAKAYFLAKLKCHQTK